MRNQPPLAIGSVVGRLLVEGSVGFRGITGDVEALIAEAIDQGVAAVAILFRKPVGAAISNVRGLDHRRACAEGAAGQAQHKAVEFIHDGVVAVIGGDETPDGTRGIVADGLGKACAGQGAAAAHVDNHITGAALELI